MTPWEATINLLRTMPKQRNMDHINFKAADPADVLSWMRTHPGANTIDAVISGMKHSRSTVKRVLATLVAEGALLVDKDSHPRHFVYRVADPN